MIVKKESMYSLFFNKNESFDFYVYRTKRTLFSKKYGVDLIHFIHGTEQVLHGSTKVDGMNF